MRTTEQKITTLKAWLNRRKLQAGKYPVTADELICRIKRNWPETTDQQIEVLYQAVGDI